DVGADRVEDEVEFAVVADEEVLLAGGEHPLRPEGERLGFLPQSAGEHGDLGAHGRGDLDAHVAEPAEADDGDLLGRPVVLLAGSPAGQRLIGGDARAQQRGGDVEVEGVGDPADEAFVDDDLLGVAALGDRAVDVGGVVGADISSQAVLLLTGRALLAFAAGVDQAAHAHPVADLPVGDRVTDGLDDPGDLVADGEREVRLTPFVADGVDVAVADAGCPDVDDHVIGARGATFDHAHTERLIGAGLLQCLDGDAHRISLCSNVRGWATSSSTCSRTVYSKPRAPYPGPAQSLPVGWASVGWGLVGGAPVGGDRRQPGQSLPQIGQPGQGPFGSGALDDEVAGESSLVTGRAPGPLLVCGGRVEAVRRPLQPLPV